MTLSLFPLDDNIATLGTFKRPHIPEPNTVLDPSPGYTSPPLVRCGPNRNIGIRESVEITATKARMRVLIDVLKPLIKTATLDFDLGEEAMVTLVYENLERHCTSCGMLDHEAQDCPLAVDNTPYVSELEKGTERLPHSHQENRYKSNQPISRTHNNSHSNQRTQTRVEYQFDHHTRDDERRYAIQHPSHPAEHGKRSPIRWSKPPVLPYSRSDRSNY